MLLLTFLSLQEQLQQLLLQLLLQRLQQQPQPRRQLPQHPPPRQQVLQQRHQQRRHRQVPQRQHQRQLLQVQLVRQLLTSTTSTTSATSTCTTSATATTTIAPCPTGYVRTPSGSCVNLLIDFNNCGTISYVCASSYTSCSNGACSGAPGVQLAGGVSVTGWGGSTNIDDAYLTLTVPFAITMYGYSTSTPSVQSNGCVCLAGCSTAYYNTGLPSSSFSGATTFGYWDDLYIYAGTSQTVYYGTTGTSPNRNLVFEFYTAHFGAPTQYYHFQMVYYEATPGIVRYYYFQSSDGGASATIGTQASGSGTYMQYSYIAANSVPVGSSSTNSPTFTLTFNTNTNTYASSR